jgi:hypothetical protein
MKVYISGKITDNPTWVKDFNAAEDKIKNLENIEVVNPVNLDKEDDITDRFSKEAWFRFMDRDMRQVEKCDAIILLKGKSVNWKKSPGARIEYWTAKKFRKRIFYGVEQFLSWYYKEQRYEINNIATGF